MVGQFSRESWVAAGKTESSKQCLEQEGEEGNCLSIRKVLITEALWTEEKKEKKTGSS